MNNIVASNPKHKIKPVTFKNIKSAHDLFSRMALLTHNTITQLNNSKLFAGFMIIILNIASKYVNIRLSKTVESYLKHTFSRDILIFAISWMGTRDIYIATMITFVFIIFVDFLFNEESSFCCLPESFMDYHISRLDISKNTLSSDEIKHAEMVLEKAKNINKQFESENVVV